MKRFSFVMQLALVAAIGCSAQPGPVANSSAAPESTPVGQSDADEGATALTFVSLKVPNMV
jgi:hypothetical protein